MSYTATGTILDIGERRQVSERFAVRTFVLEIADGRYPQVVEFECNNDNCDQLDEHGQGEVVDVEFNLRGRYAKDGNRVWNKLVVWKIKHRGGAVKSTREPPPDLDDGPETLPIDDVPF